MIPESMLIQNLGTTVSTLYAPRTKRDGPSTAQRSPAERLQSRPGMGRRGIAGDQRRSLCLLDTTQQGCPWSQRRPLTRRSTRPEAAPASHLGHPGQYREDRAFSSSRGQRSLVHHRRAAVKLLSNVVAVSAWLFLLLKSGGRQPEVTQYASAAWWGAPR